MTIRPPGLVTRTISLATSNGLGANIAPKMLTTRSNVSSASSARSQASPSWNRQFAQAQPPRARRCPPRPGCAAMSTPSTSAPQLRGRDGGGSVAAAEIQDLQSRA